MQSGKADVRVDYSQYYLTPADVHGQDAEENGTDDGFLMASTDAIWVQCGTDHGMVSVEVQLLDGPPESVDPSWEAVVERNLSTASGERRLATWDNVWPPEFPVIPEGGEFRLRAYARGRDRARQTAIGEEHLLCVWPAPPAPEVILAMDLTGKPRPTRAATTRDSDLPRPPSRSSYRPIVVEESR